MANVIPGRLKGGAIRPSIKLWPNGEFSMGYAPGGALEEEMSWADWSEGVSGDIGLSIVSNSHKDLEEEVPRRGQKGITPGGARMLRNSLDVMEKYAGKERLSFGTVTLPSLEYEEFWMVSTCWSEIVRRFYQKLSRALGKQGGSASYAGCTELQPARTERESVPALHLHFVFVGRHTSRGGWLVSPAQLRRWWKEVLEKFVGRELDCRATENLERVRKSASCYMAKYLSKGSSVSPPLMGGELGWSLPTAWYNVSLKLKRHVKDNVRTSPELATLVEGMWVDGLLECSCEYFYQGIIEEMVGPGPHYCIGRLREDVLRDVLDIWRAGSVAACYDVA